MKEKFKNALNKQTIINIIIVLIIIYLAYDLFKDPEKTMNTMKSGLYYLGIKP